MVLTSRHCCTENDALYVTGLLDGENLIQGKIKYAFLDIDIAVMSFPHAQAARKE